MPFDFSISALNPHLSFLLSDAFKALEPDCLSFKQCNIMFHPHKKKNTKNPKSKLFPFLVEIMFNVKREEMRRKHLSGMINWNPQILIEAFNNLKEGSRSFKWICELQVIIIC